MLLKYANYLFKAGRIDSALDVLDKASKVYDGNKFLKENIAFNQELYSYKKRNQVSIPAIITPEITVVLTTISKRLPHVFKVIESLHKQTLMPKEIILYISKEPYLLDDGISSDDLQEFNIFEKLKIVFTANTGPYRKILPYLNSLNDEGIRGDNIFVTVDDDTLYPDYFLDQLYKSHIKFGGVIAFRGRKIELDQSGTMISSYSAWGPGVATPSILNIPTGKDGVLYRRSYFDNNFLQINGALRCAPTADDLWIKWHTTLNFIPSTILNPEACLSDYKSFPLVSYQKEDRDISLYASHNSSGSGSKNDISVSSLEDYFLECYGFKIAEILSIS